MSVKPPPVAQRSGSETRQDRYPVSVQVSASEWTALEMQAHAAGMSIGSYLRACALDSAGPRAKCSPPVNVELFALAIAQLHKVGSNITHIARALNTVGSSIAANEAFAALVETRAAVTRILEIVGRKARA